MKASAALINAIKLMEKVDILIRPITESFAEILDDDSAHVTLQSGDGFCLCYDHNGFSKNALLCSSQIDNLLSMSKDDLLIALEKFGI